MGNGAEQGLSRREFLKTITQFGELALAAPLLAACTPATADTEPANLPSSATATAVPSPAGSPRPDIKPSASFSAEPKPTADPTASLSPKPDAKPTFAPGFSPAETIKEPGWLHYTDKEGGYELDLPPAWSLSATVTGGSKADYTYTKNLTVPGIIGKVGAWINLKVGEKTLNMGNGIVTDFTLSGQPGKRAQTIAQPRSNEISSIAVAAIVKGNRWSLFIYGQDEVESRNFDKVASSFKVNF